MFLARIEV